MNEGSGTNLTDSSGNDHNGSVIDSPSWIGISRSTMGLSQFAWNDSISARTETFLLSSLLMIAL